MMFGFRRWGLSDFAGLPVSDWSNGSPAAVQIAAMSNQVRHDAA
jgi:hypothetical protein